MKRTTVIINGKQVQAFVPESMLETVKGSEESYVLESDTESILDEQVSITPPKTSQLIILEERYKKSVAKFLLACCIVVLIIMLIH